MVVIDVVRNAARAFSFPFNRLRVFQELWLPADEDEGDIAAFVGSEGQQSVGDARK